MKIQYIKPTHDSYAGDVKDVAEPFARVLLRLGFALPYPNQKAQADTAPDTDSNSDKSRKKTVKNKKES